MGELSLQWSLNQTSNDVIGISTGLIKAATSDNVQVLALLACERFGATLAMSPESCHKAFLLCDRSHKSVLTFLQLQVGYMKGDSAYHLARSDAGLRFLGLVAALGTMHPWNAAIVLHTLISETAKDRTMVPPHQHLKQLIKALDPRLAMIGFCESVMGWSKLTVAEGKAAELLDTSIHEQSWPDQGLATPDPRFVSELVAALSHIARVGDENVLVRVITPFWHGAWFIAFIKWCLGEPPRIMFENGHTFNSDTTSRVSVVLLTMGGTSNRVHIETYSHLETIRSLVDTSAQWSIPVGFVSIPTYGDAYLPGAFGRPANIEYQACLQILPHACSFVSEYCSRYTLHFLDGIPTSVNIPQKDWLKMNMRGPKTSGEAKVLAGRAFPTDESIYKTICEYQGLRFEGVSSTLPKVGMDQWKDLPLVSSAILQLSQDCTCNVASIFGHNCCRLSIWSSKIVKCVADVLALSLLQPTGLNGVKIRFPFSYRSPSGRGFIDFVSTVLSGELPEVSYRDLVNGIGVFGHVLELLGHDHVGDQRWIMSSRSGQTIFPQVFATGVVEQSGILCIGCLPGTILLHGSEQFPIVFADLPLGKQTSDPDFTADPVVPLAPRNDFSAHDMKWELSRHDNALGAKFSFRGIPRNPMDILSSALRSIFVYCPHDRGSTFLPENLTIFECSPFGLAWRKPGSVGVVHSDKNEPVRLCAFADDKPCVVRMQSCLECCVQSGVLNNLAFIVC